MLAGAMTTDAIEIKPATAVDAEGISCMVIRALRETNPQDYAPEIIDALVSAFSPERIASLIASRQVYVAIAHGMIIGTASLQGSVVRTVFVDPDHQGKGIGARLMDVVESLARARSTTTLSVPSSLTAPSRNIAQQSHSRYVAQDYLRKGLEEIVVFRDAEDRTHGHGARD